MISILKVAEAVGERPTFESGLLSADAEALDLDAIWARMERFIAWRWTPRSVVWTIRTDYDDETFNPALHPVTISTVEIFDEGSATWTTYTDAKNSPTGGKTLPKAAHYRITGEAGGQSPADVPAEVQEAFRRLAEYYTEQDDKPGASSYKVTIGSIDEDMTRSPNWIARALYHSGAADLLRKYRRAP